MLEEFTNSWNRRFYEVIIGASLKQTICNNGHQLETAEHLRAHLVLWFWYDVIVWGNGQAVTLSLLNVYLSALHFFGYNSDLVPIQDTYFAPVTS